MEAMNSNHPQRAPVTKKTITRALRVWICGNVYCDIVVSAGVYNDEVIVVSSRIKCDGTTMKVITNN